MRIRTCKILRSLAPVEILIMGLRFGDTLLPHSILSPLRGKQQGIEVRVPVRVRVKSGRDGKRGKEGGREGGKM